MYICEVSGQVSSSRLRNVIGLTNSGQPQELNPVQSCVAGSILNLIMPMIVSTTKIARTTSWVC